MPTPEIGAEYSAHRLNCNAENLRQGRRAATPVPAIRGARGRERKADRRCRDNRFLPRYL
jgi:hypothetical protein